MANDSARTRHVVDKVEQALILAIQQGEFGIGTQLPPIRDMAQRFGVSTTSIQIALRRLSERQLVDLRPRQGAYVKSLPHARNTTANHIAVVRHLSDMSSLASFELPSGAQSIDFNVRVVWATEPDVHRAGFDLVNILYEEDDPDPLPGILERIDRLGHGLAGALCFPNPHVGGLLPALDARKIPWVRINVPTRLSVWNFVAPDHVGDAMRVGRCLARLGYRRIVYMHFGYDRTPSHIEKIEGLFRGLLEAGAPTDGVKVVECEDWTEAAGRQAIRDILAQAGEAPEAVFAAGDLLALGAIDACRDAGLRVPEDVGVIGSTGTLPTHQDPRLTVVAQPMELLGRHAAQMLVRMARDGHTRAAGRRIPSPIVFRESILVPEDIQRELNLAYQEDVDVLQAQMEKPPAPLPILAETKETKRESGIQSPHAPVMAPV